METTETMEGIEISQAMIGARHDVALMSVSGYVDTMTCSMLLNKITEDLNKGTLHIIIDMAQVNYVSSAGWGVFVGEIKGIRERGGDLELVQMTPEVYDVFEMLEFNRILSHYDSIEEAVNDFDISIGLDITRSAKSSYQEHHTQGAHRTDTDELPKRPAARPTNSQRDPYSYQKRKVDTRILPLTEKVKYVVIDDPRRGIFKIQKELQRKRYGRVKVGSMRLYRLLRKINLETKEKRYRFYRSR